MILNGKGRTFFSNILRCPQNTRDFERELALSFEKHTPLLTAEHELDSWSLLGWTGPFIYVGQEYFIPITDEGLPANIEGIHAWVAEFRSSHVELTARG